MKEVKLPIKISNEQNEIIRSSEIVDRNGLYKNMEDSNKYLTIELLSYNFTRKSEKEVDVYLPWRRSNDYKDVEEGMEKLYNILEIYLSTAYLRFWRRYIED